MTPIVSILAVVSGAMCAVWTVLLLMQHRARRAQLLLASPAPAAAAYAADDGVCPEVCVVVAARNEAATIESCVERILDQDHAWSRVIVVDDRSEDDTAVQVERLADRDPRVRIVRVNTLPAGWLGKSHALWQATRGVESEWLLFVDADATLEPSAVRTALAEALRRDAGMLTLWPRNAAIGFWEHLIIPLCGGIIALWFGSASNEGISRPFANGQFILVRRDVYERAGGHRAVRDALIEDIPLAERCAATGAKVVAAGGAELFGVRMYDGLRATCNGWARIFVGALRSPLRLLASVVWLLLGSLLPYLLGPIVAWRLVHSPSWADLVALSMPAQHLVLIHLVSYRFWRMGRCDARYLWLYPISVLLVAAILIRAAWMLCVSRCVTWRGVRYRIDGDARIVGNISKIPRARYRLSWAVWLVLAVLAGLGLRNHRVDNSLDAWLPDLRSIGPHPSYAVVGWETRHHTRDEIVAALRSAPGLASIIDLPAVRTIGLAVGLTPENFVVSPDGSYEGIFCFRRAQVGDTEFIAGIRTALSRMNGVAIGGPAAYAAALDEISQRRMDVILAAIALLGCVLLFALTGDLRASMAGVAAITLSQVILIGTIGWLRIPMGMSLMMIPPLMMALGLSYVAHRTLRRRKGRRGGVGVLALCGLTTALGIGSFATTPLPPIRDFAIAGVAGLVLVWTAAVTLVPPADPARRRPRRVPGLPLFLALQRHAVIVRAAAFAVLVAAPLTAPHLRFVSDPLDFFPADTPVVEDFRTLDRRLTGMLPFQVRTSVGDAAFQIARAPGVRKVIDITPLVAGSARAERTLWCLADNDALPKLTSSVPFWRAAAAARGASFEWIGVAAQLNGTEQIVRGVAVSGLSLMGATVAAVVMLVLRHAPFALVAAVVSLLPVAGLILVAVALDVPLGIPSLMIGSITVGVAVDDVLHISCTARDRGSARRALQDCWNPCAGSSLINVACLSCFLLSPFGPTRQFGLLLSASILFALLANQLLLPRFIPMRQRPIPTVGHGTGQSPRDSECSRVFQ